MIESSNKTILQERYKNLPPALVVHEDLQQIHTHFIHYRQEDTQSIDLVYISFFIKHRHYTHISKC